MKLTKNESSSTNYLIDLDEKVKANLVTEEDTYINEERRINSMDLFENLKIIQPTKIEKKPMLINEKNHSSPKKFYKDGSAMLDNEFFKNFLGETSNLQKFYYKEFIDSLLNVIYYFVLVAFSRTII